MPGLLKFAVYITIAIIIFFVFRKKQPKPSQFDMGLSKHRAKRVSKNALPGVRKVTAEVVDEGASESQKSDIIYHGGKPHNVWKVLGVPSGAGETEVKKAFANKTQEAGADKNLILKAYKKAISLV